MIGWIALFSTRLWVKRGEGGWSNIVFAAFFSVEITDPANGLCKRANARVNYTTEHCPNSYQTDIALQKSDQKE